MVLGKGIVIPCLYLCPLSQIESLHPEDGGSMAL